MRNWFGFRRRELRMYTSLRDVEKVSKAQHLYVDCCLWSSVLIYRREKLIIWSHANHCMLTGVNEVAAVRPNNSTFSVGMLLNVFLYSLFVIIFRLVRIAFWTDSPCSYTAPRDPYIRNMTGPTLKLTQTSATKNSGKSQALPLWYILIGERIATM